MSLCPVPAQASTTDYTAPGSFTADPPDAKFELCEGGTTSVITGPGTVVTQTICCPSPGPAGPTGCSLVYKGAWTTSTSYNYLSGSPCETAITAHNGVVYICKVQHTSSATDEPGVGASWTTYWDPFTTDAADRMRWTGDWAAAESYDENDVVRQYSDEDAAGFGNAYVCILAHTSSVGNTPPNATYWAPMTDIQGALPEEQLTFLEELQESVFDWISDAVANGDWLELLAAGVGVAVAGAVITDFFTDDGIGDGQADSRYDGTPGYNGAFTAPNLQDVVSSIMEYGGYSPSDFDVSLLPTTAVSFSVAQTMSLRNLLNNLSLAYQFDIVPSGATVKFVPKNQPAVVTFNTEDLGHIGDTDGLRGSANYTAKRIQGIELPRSVTFNYNSAELDYNKFTQVATLETYEEGQDVKLEVPFTMTDAEAKRVAETALVNAHIEQQQFTFTTDYYNINVEPGDVVEIPLDSSTTLNPAVVTLRIIQVSERDDGILEFTGVRSDYNDTSYVASGVASASPPDQPTNTPVVIGYSGTLFVEAPPLRDDEVQPRVLAAVHGFGVEGWPGSALYKSIDSGSTYASVLTSSALIPMGMVASAIAAPPHPGHYVWDDTTVITVVMKQGTLGNSTDIGVQNGENWCMVGEEVIGYVNATLTAPNTYALTRLMRGRQGTETKCATHVPDSLFIKLSDAIPRLVFNNSEVGQTAKYKTVTLGSDISKATAYDMKPYGLNMRPWRVANPSAVRTGNDWILSWLERPRYNNSMRDYTEITHDFDWAGFAIAILDPSDVVVRTLTTVNNTYTYTEAQQITDFGSAQTTIKASIVQMSQTYGGGIPYVIEA